ncbi:MAG: PilN domain-containing protein, partial [Candidatus Omnitrophota bacterium]
TSEVCVCDRKNIYALRSVLWGASDIKARHFDELVYQVELTVSAYVKESFRHPLTRVLVLSSLENDNGLCEALIKESGLHVEYKFALDVNKRTLLKWPQEILDTGSSVVSGLGMVLSDGREKIDLIPIEIKEAQNRAERKIRVLRTSIIAVFSVITLSLAVSIGFFKETRRLNEMQDELQLLKPRVTKIEQRERQLKELQSLLKDRVIFSKLIQDLERLIPPGMSLLELSISDGNNLMLQGVTRESKQVNQLQKDMADSGLFSKVILNFVNKRALDQGESNYFKMTCQVKGNDSL